MMLAVVVVLTLGMCYFASKVSMKYDSSSAIPSDNPRFLEHQEFKKLFGEDGNMLVVGFDKKDIFEPKFFQAFQEWHKAVRAIQGVENSLSVPSTVYILKRDSAEVQKLVTLPIFDSVRSTDSSARIFLNLPFYKHLLYNPETHSYLTALYINKDLLKTAYRATIVRNIKMQCEQFSKETGVEMHLSGLPFIRSEFAETLKVEMRLILLCSLLLTTVILWLFFRSVGSVLLSIAVVFSGVIWALGILFLCGYKVSILSSLIAPLIVVIGIPNCIYFLNKYHTQFNIHQDKRLALEHMIDRMGVVTLFTNLTAAIGFGVFFFTKSDVLKEFGLVAGISIMVVFFISLLTIPPVLSYMKSPQQKHTRYLENKYLTSILLQLEHWVIHHRKMVMLTTLVICLLSVAGILQLQTRTFIVDDLPKNNRIYTDLKYFENRFHGVLPLEIFIDTKKKNGATTLPVLQKMDELSAALRAHPQVSKPLSITEAIKFARQAYYDGDSSSYAVPNSFDVAFLLPYLRMKTDNSKSQFNQLIRSFIDSSKRYARISVGIADVGSIQLPKLLDSIRQETHAIFDSSRYDIRFTGTSITFLEGSYFIIHSLKESLLLALIMIVVCMFLLFRNWRIVLISILTNIIPLLITAGVMGFCNIPLKPSTVLVFSVALGIAIDVTIRFLVNYKQDLLSHTDIESTVRATIQETGISIIYTSLILAAGFIVFLVSQFDGTKALGYLTALTLLLAMITNLTILPALLTWFGGKRK
jgi:predicted RND superfamily exporter protein